MSTEKSRGHDRTRTWDVVVYPESAPEDWRRILDDHHIEWACSPLHDSDANLDGEQKKPHWHLVLVFDGPKSFDQVRELTAPLNCPVPQRAHSLRGSVRYFCHLDNPEKAQYPVSAIEAHGGFDVGFALQPSSSERYALIEQMQDWVDDALCIEFSDLCLYARRNHREDWWPLLCDNSAIVMREYVKSRRHKMAPAQSSK